MELILDYKDNEGYIFKVTSERDTTITYIVAVDYQDGWYCTCEDYQFRKHKCKHIQKAQQYLKYKHIKDYMKYEPMDVFVKIKEHKKT